MLVEQPKTLTISHAADSGAQSVTLLYLLQDSRTLEAGVAWLEADLVRGGFVFVAVMAAAHILIIPGERSLSPAGHTACCGLHQRLCNFTEAMCNNCEWLVSHTATQMHLHKWQQPPSHSIACM